ncbi:hypothetical protein ACFV0R_33980 [Streptomyces sp. NPDC059578]|uniref:hypothetical protein n=1 Tax=Streptomyces sp. NPDC059578 TaxID=3346874 RepID=UPI0036B56C10
MNSQLKIRMKGTFAEGQLAVFRDRVGLSRRGRLDDAWDEEFGRRELRPKEAGLVKLSLWRYADDDWMIALYYEREPLPAEESEDLRRTILDAAAQAGLTVTAQLPS